VTILPEAEYVCPAGFLCGWSVGVEFVFGLPERPSSQQKRFLQAPIGVNATGDAGDAFPAIFGQPGTKCLISPKFVKIVIKLPA